MEYLVIGIAVALNIIIILWKYEKKRYADGTLDFILLITIAILFSGSYGALVVGTVASLVISIYLFIKPPNLPKMENPMPTSNAVGNFFSDFAERARCKL